MPEWGDVVSDLNTKDNPVISGLALRKLIGLLGISLPLVLMIGNWIFSRTSPPGSISGYYYTDMRNILVGGLCALGALLLAYRGRDNVDSLITDVAGASVILVALCPTKPQVGLHHHLAARPDAVGDLHVLFAASTLIALGVMALRFAQVQRRPESVIYRACAATIFSCVLLATVSGLLLRSISVSSRPLFVSEVLAMVAAGISWFVPGRAITFPARTPAMTQGQIQVAATAAATAPTRSLMPQ
jgi:hypothetical protein